MATCDMPKSAVGGDILANETDNPDTIRPGREEDDQHALLVD